MGTYNQYYSNNYDSCVPIESYGEQFKNYLDKKLKDIANDEDITNIITSINNSEKVLSDSLVNVESNLTQSIVNSTNKTVCCVKHAIAQSEEAINENVNCAKEEIICNINCVGENIKANSLTIAENVQSNLSNAITTSADNVVNALGDKISSSEENIKNEISKNSDENNSKVIEAISQKIDETSNDIQSNLTNAITMSADNVVKANEVISKNIESNLSNAITTSADNVVKANEVVSKNIQNNLTNVVINSSNNVTNVVKSESSDQKAKIDKLRTDLIQAINNSDSLTAAGFSDLNSSVIANKEDAVYRINRQANVNKKEILDAINNISFEPYAVYGGTVLNIIHNNISTISESDILKLSSVNVDSYTPDIQFSIRITDVKVDNMNDDPTGEIFNNAKEQNELNVVFAYPKKYDAVEIYDSIDLNITKFFDKKDIIVNGEEYIVAMQYSKIINLYDPKWEVPTDYTLNYTLNIG